MENRLPDGLGRRGYWVQMLGGDRGNNSAFQSSGEIPATSNCRVASISSSNQRNRPAKQDNQRIKKCGDPSHTRPLIAVNLALA